MGRKLFIAGQWVDGVSETEIVNPATGEVAERVARASKEQVGQAVSAARKVFDEGKWPRMRVRERARLLERIGEKLSQDSVRMEMARTETLQSGATLRRTMLGDAGIAGRYFFHLAELIHRFPYEEGMPYRANPDPCTRLIRREPLGVCAAITPWNAPLVSACWKIGPALAMGNTVVCKPASYTPLTTLDLARVISECDVPPGVLSVVCGPGAEIGEALVQHPAVDKISLTGSTEAGRRVMELAAGGIKRLTLELGGKSASIVLGDANLDIATDGILYGAFFNSGQACTSGTRLFVPDAMHDAIIERLVARARTLKLGDPMEMTTDMGPLISKSQLDRVLEYIDIGKKEGARLATGGGRPAGLERGYYVEPTIFGNVRNDMRIAREEIFGPVLSVIRYKSEDEAIAMANDTTYGLAGGVWSRDIKKAERLASRLRAGTVWVNEWHMLSDAPFGGYKQSGLGREGGLDGLLEYTETKHLYISLTDRIQDRIWYKILLSQ